MKNFFELNLCAISSLIRKTAARFSGLRLFAVIALSLALLAGIPHLIGQAQRSEVPSKVWNLAAQPSGPGTVVWITADGPLGRPQNWQDSEGFHVVLPNTVSGESLKSVKGVKVRRVGTSLEVVLQTKPGSKVSLQSDGNELSLLVDKKLEPRSEVDARTTDKNASEPHLYDDSAQTRQVARDTAPARVSQPAENYASNPRGSGEIAHTASNWSAPMGPTTALPAGKLPQQPDTNPSAIGDETKIEVEDEGALASIFSATSVFVVIALGAFGLLVSRKLRSRQAAAPAGEKELSEDAEWVEDQTLEGKLRVQNEVEAPGTSLVKSGGSAVSRQSNRTAISGPTSLYGAYRIDQEVGKLLLGQPHRMDVLSSRAIDDRRAIETSLIKGMNAPGMDETARRRTREALEEYGFVARQCAALLLAPDAFERTSAARLLGEIKSESALPFLLESLYDSESIVRNQAVVSIGELKLPSAIGALLDIARTHPDVPSALLSRTLSACSVEGLDFFDAMPIEPAQLQSGHDLSIVDQITHLEPASSVEELPVSSDEEQLAHALMLSSSEDVQERAEALKALGQFRVQSAVDSLSRIARNDSEPNLRSMAVSSLGAIDHESVFPAILIGMADESREVRAAAARALNRLSFDRADAYVRVIETGDQDTIGKVARACVQAGIVSQNLDRLSSSDHRQAYETFSLICLLATADMNDPVLDAIASHPNMDVRLKTVHLLASTGQPETFEHLRQLAVREGVAEEVKTALLEAMYKLDQESKRQEKPTVEAAEADIEPHFEASEAESFESHSQAFDSNSESGESNSESFESNSEFGFAFAFEPTTQPEVQPELQREVGTEQDELEV